MKRRIALCVGVNAYPGAPLQGCVNDAKDWQATLLHLGYDVQMLQDSEVTKANLVQQIRSRLTQLRTGDRFVFTFSGHGTWLPDRDGDEIDGRDEALCCFDFAKGGLLLDDELQAIFSDRAPGSRVTVLSDSCHSGTLTRFIDPNAKAKFISPAEIPDVTGVKNVDEAARAEAFASNNKSRSEAVLISGCADHEYSYDATIEGRPNGAFTYYARKALEKSPTPRVKDVYATIRSLLPSQEYPQTPQLTAGIFQKNSVLL
jgi:uncharacterized caspase-like protein